MALACSLGFAAAPSHLAVSQAYPPFALVAGLLLIGAVAAHEGLFAWLGGVAASLPGGTPSLFVASMALVALVTAVLTLDTAVVFLTPVLLHMAWRRRLDPAPFLFGCVFMSNSASLLLPGANLTNLLVLSEKPVPGALFAARMLPAWVAAVIVTIAVVALAHRTELGDAGNKVERPARPRLGPGGAATVVAIVLVLALQTPALPVLGLGIVTALIHVFRARAGRPLVEALNAPLLGGLFGVMVGLGTLARLWGAPGRLMAGANHAASAAIGAVTSVAINNLPAAVLLASTPPAHPRALLIGLDVGPNLAITGSLSALFWLQVARTTGADPSPARYSRLGVVLTPLAVAAALAATALFAPGSL